MQKQRNANIKAGKIYAVILHRWIHGVNYFSSLTTRPDFPMINDGMILLSMFGTDREFLNMIMYTFSVY